MLAPTLLTQNRFLEVLLQNGAHVYLVGGSVRDQILQKTTKDFDLVVCGLTYQKIAELLKPLGRTSLVGKSFGVMKFSPDSHPNIEFDIALPRKEKSTGSGHRDFKVEFDPNLSITDDLGRRDFTMNAIALDLKTSQKIDPFAGENDIIKKQIRTVFDNSFLEDPLRMLRAIQFAARLNFTIKDNTWKQLQKHCQLIETVAKERIMIELEKLFLAEKPSHGFDLMRDSGILPYVFPDVQNMIGVTQPNKNNEDVYTHTMKVLDAARAADELEKPGDINIMFSALFHDAGKPKTRRQNEDSGKVTFYNHQHISTGIAWRWMKDFRASTIGVKPKQVCHLVKHHMFETKEFHNEKALRRFIRKVGKQNVLDLIDLRLADKKGGRFPKKVWGILQLREQIKKELAKKPPFGAKDLALSGTDIMSLGLPEGPVIGKIQKSLVEIVLDNPEYNTVEKLTEVIQNQKTEWLQTENYPKRKKQ